MTRGKDPSPVTRRLMKAPSRDTLSPRERAASPDLWQRAGNPDWSEGAGYRGGRERAEGCGGAARRPAPTAFCLQLSAFCFLLSAFCLSCGYHVAGRGERLPPDIKTIAVPIFVNQSQTFRIEQKLAAAISHEFLERTKFQITTNPTAADAILKGTVKDVRRGVITYDLTTGRASSLQIQVMADVQLEDLHSKKVVYANPNFVFREEYQVNQVTAQLFEEDQAALDRLSRDVARTLVSELLENF